MALPSMPLIAPALTVSTRVQGEMAKLVAALHETTQQLSLQHERHDIAEDARIAWQAEAGEWKDRHVESQRLCLEMNEQLRLTATKVEALAVTEASLTKENGVLSLQVLEAADELQGEQQKHATLLHAKNQLQGQVKQMVAAEHQLTENLKEAHSQIDRQLFCLKAEVRFFQDCGFESMPCVVENLPESAVHMILQATSLCRLNCSFFYRSRPSEKPRTYWQRSGVNWQHS